MFHVYTNQRSLFIYMNIYEITLLLCKNSNVKNVL